MSAVPGATLVTVTFRIELTGAAQAHLNGLTARDRQLSDTPLLRTRKRKPLRANRLAPWELRVGDLRVFYDVAADDRTVFILAIGVKHGNILRIGGTVFEL